MSDIQDEAFNLPNTWRLPALHVPAPAGANKCLHRRLFAFPESPRQNTSFHRQKRSGQFELQGWPPTLSAQRFEPQEKGIEGTKYVVHYCKCVVIYFHSFCYFFLSFLTPSPISFVFDLKGVLKGNKLSSGAIDRGRYLVAVSLNRRISLVCAVSETGR